MGAVGGAAAGVVLSKGTRVALRKGTRAALRSMDRNIAGATNAELVESVLKEVPRVLFVQGARGARQVLKKKKVTAGIMAAGAGVGALIARHRENKKKRNQTVRVVMGPKTRASIEKLAQMSNNARLFAHGMRA